METRSTHLLIELWEADRGKLDSVPEIRKILLQSAHHAGVTVLHSAFHKFNPMGVSGVVVIAESHISIHTWPEQGYAAADIFTCGNDAMPELAAEYLSSAFRAQHVEISRITRGIKHKSSKQSLQNRRHQPLNVSA